SAANTRFVGQVITGGSVSTIVTAKTLTVKEHVVWLPLASVAMLVTVVVPMGKVLPLGGRLTTLTAPAQLSVAVTTKVTLLRAHWPGSASRTRLFVGQLIVGPSVSFTITNCWQVDRFP